MSIKIENVHTMQYDSIVPWLVVGWDHNGARYHVNCDLSDDDTFEIRVDGHAGRGCGRRKTLYKSPPLGVNSRRDVGYFPTRYLFVDTPANRRMIEQAFDFVRKNDLVKKARADLEARRDTEKADGEKRRRENFAKAAGPDLLEALRVQRKAFDLLYSMATKQTKHNFAIELAERGLTQHDQRAAEAIAKAEGK